MHRADGYWALRLPVGVVDRKQLGASRGGMSPLRFCPTPVRARNPRARSFTFAVSWAVENGLGKASNPSSAIQSRTTSESGSPETMSTGKPGQRYP